MIAWSDGGSQQKYAGWKSRPRKQIRCFPWTRSTLRSSLELRECRTAQEQTNVEQDEVTSEISRTLLRPMRKLGYKSIQDRMEKDPFYLFNNAVGQITPDCCQFLEDLAKCIAPDFGRTREKREKQLGTGVSTRLIFMPDFNRDPAPAGCHKRSDGGSSCSSLHTSSVCRACRRLSESEGEPTPTLFGWSGSMMPIDQQSAQDCFFDLVDFAKRQWNEQFHNIKGEEHSMVRGHGI